MSNFFMTDECRNPGGKQLCLYVPKSLSLRCVACTYRGVYKENIKFLLDAKYSLLAGRPSDRGEENK